MFVVRSSELKEIGRSALQKLSLLLFIEIEGHPAIADGLQEVGNFDFVENRFHASPVVLLHHEVGKIDCFHFAGFKKRVYLAGEFRLELFLALKIL